MYFDFENFFRSLGIPCFTSGKNVKRGWCNIDCPFCGNDHGHHLGANPQTGGWACWKDKTHRSGGPAKLVQALKGCTWAEARRIAGEDVQAAPESIEHLEQQVEALSRPEKDYFARVVRLLDEFIEIRPGSRLSSPFAEYLRNRGFPDPYSTACYYSLRACVSGPWRNRLILPFFHTLNQIIGWQGRAIGRLAELRYLSHPDSSATKKFLFNRGNALKRGRTLVVVEGPLDCLKVDYFGRKHGIRAVATLGTSYTDAQVAQIDKLAPRFERLVILYDPEALTEALGLQARLTIHQPALGFCPAGVEDPGALKPDQVADCIMECLK